MNDWQAAANMLEQCNKQMNSPRLLMTDFVIIRTSRFSSNGLVYFIHISNQSSTVSKSKSVKSIENITRDALIFLFYIYFISLHIINDILD